MRSKLFVPGSRPDLFAKACSGSADAISFDLEDSVAPASKAQARGDVAAFLAGNRIDAGKILIVRVNAIESGLFEDDVEALLPAAPTLLNLPRVESSEQVLAAVAIIERLEGRLGGSARPGLLLNIETPRGLRLAADIATAHPRVAGLQLGLGDLFEPNGIRRDDPASVHQCMFQVAIAAAEAGVFACDGAHPDYSQPEPFLGEAAQARALGFVGKSCIHPRQVDWANQAFAPTDEELAWAHKVVAAARRAQADGQAAFALDGRMIDPPYLLRAERLLRQAGTSESDFTTGAACTHR